MMAVEEDLLEEVEGLLEVEANRNSVAAQQADEAFLSPYLDALVAMGIHLEETYYAIVEVATSLDHSLPLKVRLSQRAPESAASFGQIFTLLTLVLYKNSLLFIHYILPIEPDGNYCNFFDF